LALCFLVSGRLNSILGFAVVLNSVQVIGV